MLEYIKGNVAEIDRDRIIVDVNGIGIEIFSTRELVNCVELSSDILIPVYVYLSEDGVKIFGFANKMEKRVFVELISVPDIGPTKAIKILSSLSVSVLVDSILNERLDLLSEVSGVGIKSAKKLITFLKDKFIKYKEAGIASSSYNIYMDVKKALRQLGYKDGEINLAIEKLDRRRVGNNLEDAIKECINYLASR